MWRRFFFVVGFAAIALTGACSNDTSSEAVTTPTATLENNVDKIAFVGGRGMDLQNCAGTNSILRFKFASTGTGHVKVLVVRTDDNTVVGQTEQDVTSNESDVAVEITDGKVAQAEIIVEADNWVVPAGQKSLTPNAKNSVIQNEVGLENCALKAQQQASMHSVWIRIAGLVIAILLLPFGLWYLIRLITKKPEVKATTEEDSAATPSSEEAPEKAPDTSSSDA